MTSPAPFVPRNGSPPIEFEWDMWGVLESMLELNEQHGGTQGLLCGRPGSGKSTILAWLEAFFVWLGHIVVHRGRQVDYWSRFPGKVRIYSNYPLAFTRLAPGARHGERVDIPYTTFESPADLLDLLEPGRLNVVYMRETAIGLDRRGRAVEAKTHVWLDFLHVLARKPDNLWWALFLDELHEIVPSRQHDEDWHRVKRAADDLADLRKRYVSLYGATHYYDSIYDEFVAKLQFFLWMKGSRLPHWSALTHTGLVGGLPRGAAIVEDRANFLELRFPKLRDIDHYIRVDEDLYPEPVKPRGGGAWIDPRPSTAADPIPPPPSPVKLPEPPAAEPKFRLAVDDETYNAEVERILEDALDRIERKELEVGDSSVRPDGWDLWACGCQTRREGKAFVLKPCGSDPPCTVRTAIAEAAKAKGTPVVEVGAARRRRPRRAPRAPAHDEDSERGSATP